VANDRELRVRALTQLAIATREKLEPQTIATYLDDVARVSTPILVAACERLRKSAEWFPKVRELLDACQAVAHERKMREELNRPRLNPPPEPTAEQKAIYLQRIKDACRGIKVMK
jgi:hypothetical protein